MALNPASMDVLYRGSVSNLDRALGEIASGNAVSEASTSSAGCNLNFATRDQHASNPVSYSQDIAPLLEENCARCHHDGGIGLFPMDSHQTIQAWAPLMRNAVLTKLMPPGQTDPHIGGALIDNRHLSGDHLQKLVHWIDAGAVNDTDADPLAALEWPATEWPLGEPDDVIQIPPKEVPATGVMDALVWTDPGYEFDSDRWLKGATALPGDRSVVHHIAVRVIPPGVGEPTEEMTITKSFEQAGPCRRMLR